MESIPNRCPSIGRFPGFAARDGFGAPEQLRDTRTMNATGSTTPLPRTEIRDRIGELADRWDALVETQRIPSPFLMSWWIDNACIGRLAVVAVFRGDELVGGAAFESAPWGPGILSMEKVTVAGGGLLAPDHIDIISTPADRDHVAHEVLAWLLRPGHRVIELDGLTADGTLAAMFHDELVETFDAPYAVLPSDHDDYVKSRPGKVRSTIKRRSKHLTAEGVGFSSADLSDPADLERALTAFSELHDMRWAERSGFLEAFERFRTALIAAADHGDVSINELRLESGQTIAVEIDFRIGDRLYFYQAGRRTEREWRGSGTVLRARVIETAIADGVREYDMLRGDEPYKDEWATDKRFLSTHLSTVGTRARTALGLRSARSRIRELSDRAPWRSRPSARIEQSD